MDAIVGLGGVLLGFLLGLLPPWLERKKRRRVHFAALKGELEICADFAATYMRDNVQAPLYRLPDHAYSTAIPALLLDGALSGAEFKTLSEYYTLVWQLNRGLDSTDHFHRVEHHQLRNAEYERARLKAEQLLADAANGKYSAAQRVVASHL